MPLGLHMKSLGARNATIILAAVSLVAATSLYLFKRQVATDSAQPVKATPIDMSKMSRRTPVAEYKPSSEISVLLANSTQTSSSEPPAQSIPEKYAKEAPDNQNVEGNTSDGGGAPSADVAAIGASNNAVRLPRPDSGAFGKWKAQTPSISQMTNMRVRIAKGERLYERAVVKQPDQLLAIGGRVGGVIKQ